MLDDAPPPVRTLVPTIAVLLAVVVALWLAGVISPPPLLSTLTVLTS